MIQWHQSGDSWVGSVNGYKCFEIDDIGISDKSFMWTFKGEAHNCTIYNSLIEAQQAAEDFAKEMINIFKTEKDGNFIY